MTQSHFVWCLVLQTLLVQASTGIMCPKLCMCHDTNVSCSNSELTTIPHFLDPRINVLDLSKTLIKRIDSGLDFYSHLTILNMSYSHITFLGIDQFHRLMRLEELYLEENRIRELESGAFHGLSSLQFLNLRRNRLQNLTKEVFTGLVALEKLDLSENQISQIDQDAFAYMHGLKTLKLSHNLIREVGIWLDPLHGLSRLSLSQNLLSSLGHNISLPLLQELDLSDNLLSSIPASSLSLCPSLRKLDGSYNKIGSIPQVSNLTELLLSGNMLRQLTQMSLETLRNVRVLYLNNMPLLDHVSHDSFQGFSQLEVLSLANDKRLAPLASNTFQDAISLKVLDLSQLRWTSLAPDQIPPHLERLRLGGTPLKCSCSLYWLWKLQQNRPNLLEGASCDEQPLNIMAVDDSLHCAEDDYALIVGVVSGSLAILILIVLVVIAYSCIRSREKSRYHCDYLRYIPYEDDDKHQRTNPPPSQSMVITADCKLPNSHLYVAKGPGKDHHSPTTTPLYEAADGLSNHVPTNPKMRQKFTLSCAKRAKNAGNLTELPMQTLDQAKSLDPTGIMGMYETSEPLYYTVTANPLDEYCQSSSTNTSGYMGTGSAYTSSSASSDSRSTLPPLRALTAATQPQHQQPNCNSHQVVGLYSFSRPTTPMSGANPRLNNAKWLNTMEDKRPRMFPDIVLQDNDHSSYLV